MLGHLHALDTLQQAPMASIQFHLPGQELGLMSQDPLKSIVQTNTSIPFFVNANTFDEFSDAGKGDASTVYGSLDVRFFARIVDEVVLSCRQSHYTERFVEIIADALDEAHKDQVLL